MKTCYAFFLIAAMSLSACWAHDDSSCDLSTPPPYKPIVQLNVSEVFHFSLPHTSATWEIPPKRGRLHKRLFRALYRLLLEGAGSRTISRNRYRWGQVVEYRTDRWVDSYHRRGRSGSRNYVDHILEEWEYGNPGQRHIQQCNICGPAYCGLYDSSGYQDPCLCEY